MIIKCYYNKTCGMSDGKIASQVAHAVAGLLKEANVEYTADSKVIVLGKRAQQFYDLFDDLEGPKYMQRDKGYTELNPGSHTAFAYFETDEPNT